MYLHHNFSDAQTHSSASRPALESEGEALQAIGVVELQKLGVVPQTIFLKSKASDAQRAAHTLSSRRSNLEQGLRRLTPADTPRGSRTMSIDLTAADAPFEDLRRRLATINGSSASLQAGLPPRDRRSSAVVSPQGTNLTSPNMEDLPLPYERPGSPVESVVSGTNSSLAYRSLHRLQPGGSTDGQKAAPAIGSVRTNATGVLEAAMHLRSDEPSEPSGRSSPSLTGTVRGGARPRLASLVPPTSYGKKTLVLEQCPCAECPL
jgi:phosphoinositide-3-kinase, regulatory subunit 4